MDKKNWIKIELEQKTDFEEAMERVYAWYNQEIIDRAPIRFSAHNAEYSSANKIDTSRFNSLEERWFDVEYQLDVFEHNLKNSVFNAETFPFYWPNLGPDIFAAFYGVKLVFKEVTSFSVPIIKEWKQMENLTCDFNNKYFKKIEELTRAALERGKGKYLVGYTSFATGLDTAAAFRGPQQLCLDFLMEPEYINSLIEKSFKDYFSVYSYFDTLIKDAGGLSISWMGIPSFERMHIAQTDFATMLSPALFNEFVLSHIKEEVKPYEQVIFHMDGKGVANHVDSILEIPEINAIQWVQGVGADLPIMQWIPLIKKIQKAGKSVVVNLEVSELDAFMSEVDPIGIFLCLEADSKIQLDIMKKVKKWTCKKRYV